MLFVVGYAYAQLLDEKNAYLPPFVAKTQIDYSVKKFLEENGGDNTSIIRVGRRDVLGRTRLDSSKYRTVAEKKLRWLFLKLRKIYLLQVHCVVVMKILVGRNAIG